VCEDLGVPEEHHLVRPLLRRGFSGEGLEVGKRGPGARTDRGPVRRLLAPGGH